MLDSKLLKPRRGTNKCKLFIKGDWNDADYITEDTSLSIDDLKESLPYFSILLDLFKFDNDYRRKTRDYRIDIRVDFDRALAFYLDHNDNFYPQLLELKKNKEILSGRLISLDEDNFEDVYYEVLQNIKDCFDYNVYLPRYEDWGIHNIVDMYIDYKGNKYDVQPGKTLEAFAELMDMEYDNFACASEMNKEMENRIKTIRENASLTQDEVAKYLGISKEKYAGIELGIFPPTLIILNQLSKLFKVSVKMLTENSKESNYADFNIAKETKEKLDMIDLFYANKNLYKKLIYQKQGKGVK